jgi:hypothetical protein
MQVKHVGKKHGYLPVALNVCFLNKLMFPDRLLQGVFWLSRTIPAVTA